MENTHHNVMLHLHGRAEKHIWGLQDRAMGGWHPSAPQAILNNTLQ